jgi:hypothetical protein
MKTTNKVFKDQIQAHIIEGLSEDQHTELPLQLQDAVKGFNNWYGKYEQKRKPNRQKAFQEWLNCLPSELSTEFTNYGINQTLKGWWETADQEYKEQDSDKEANLYTALVYREFNTLCKKNGIQF